MASIEEYDAQIAELDEQLALLGAAARSARDTMVPLVFERERREEAQAARDDLHRIHVHLSRVQSERNDLRRRRDRLKASPGFEARQARQARRGR